MKLDRSSGILLHITSLNGANGIGTLGKEAREFAGAIRRAGFTYWQILPIGPVRDVFGYSPYATSSTFAGNPLCIDLPMLAREPWFSGHLDTSRFQDGHFVLFEDVKAYSDSILPRAHESFKKNAGAGDRAKYDKFRGEHGAWLEDYALFTALSERFETAFWPEWDAPIASRDPGAMAHWSETLAGRIDFHRFVQYCFFSQWREFKNDIHKLGVDLIGDIPIYITMESADAWAHPEILQIDKTTRLPSSVAGVPPDYFSATGQRWGNPLYRWTDAKGGLDATTLSWWISRIRHLINLVDVIRIDHFRGFEAFWSIPYKEKTAVKGEWVRGPGALFFNALKKELGDLPLIAEDLGVITPEVEKLRDEFGFPGMRILQFAFDFNNKNTYLPHNIDNRNCVLYTGTHDNNTTNGWFYGPEISDETRSYVLEYIGTDRYEDFHRRFIRMAYGSVADLVVIPAQDILGFGAEFRMNTPGTGQGNWGWKMTKNALTDEIIEEIKRMGKIYRRIPGD